MGRLQVFLWVVAGIMGPSFVAAQNPEIDSLEHVYSEATSDSAKFDALKTLCFKIVGVDSAKTELYCTLLAKDVENCHDPVQKADAYAAIGDYYNARLDFSSSLVYFHKSMAILKTAKGSRAEIAYAKCLLDYAYIFHVNGDFNTALTSYLEAESILDKYPEYDSRAAMYDRIASVYSDINNPQKSKLYEKKAAGIADKIVSPKLKALYYINASYSLDNKKDFDKIYALLTNARRIGDRNSLNEIVWIASYTLGDVYFSGGHYSRALSQYASALDYARRLSQRYDESITMNAIGRALSAQGKHKEAEKHLYSALALAKLIGANAVEKDIFESIASVKARQHDYKNAYRYLKLKENAIRQVFDENDQRQVNFLNAKYDAATKRAEIKQLTDEKRIQALEIDRREALTYYLGATLLLVLVAALFVQRYYRTKKKVVEQSNQLQARRISDLEREKQLAAVQYALQGEENERTRLARDLHDGLGGLLSGAKMAFSSFRENYLKNGDQAESFKHAFDLLGKSIGELQRVAHNMMPQALVNGSVKDAISEFCEKMDNNGTFSIKFRFFGKEEKLHQSYQIAVYRIVQELVNNVIKHSDATEALVQLVQENDRLSVTVQDNGKGFDPADAQSAGGHGLKNIRMRVEGLGGRFDIDSMVGRGTEVSFEFHGLAV
ncbi:MAG: sensor histidine kinase [Bacteroidetes bacterium]|nr:sensor histidine kinase [Bacteroidota bacterium]